MPSSLHYYNFSPDVTAFTTTRHGGFSVGNYASLNIKPHRGDDPLAVEKNLNVVANELGVPSERFVRQHQIHETNFRLIKEDCFKLTNEQREEWLEGIDGVATNLTGTCVGAFTADCIPVIFYDPIHRAIAAAHAGWRGTVKRIARKMVDFLWNNFNSCPDDILALIGPGITLKNFEVGQEVYDAFSNAGFDMDAIARKFPTMNPQPDSQAEKWHIDLPECNRLQLINSGLRAENITLSGIDTYDNADDYFSARRLKVGFGTMFTGLFIH